MSHSMNKWPSQGINFHILTHSLPRPTNSRCFVRKYASRSTKCVKIEGDFLLPVTIARIWHTTINNNTHKSHRIDKNSNKKYRKENNLQTYQLQLVQSHASSSASPAALSLSRRLCSPARTGAATSLARSAVRWPSLLQFSAPLSRKTGALLGV